MKKRMILVAALSAIAMLLPAAGASAGGAVVIPFTKQVFAAGDTTIWTGFAGAGTIYTTLPAEGVRPSGSVWHTNFGM